MSVVSVSCPTADITGIFDAATARTTFSSLNAMRSSNDPPPRAIIKVSGFWSSGSALKPLIAFVISISAPSPCTFTGQTITWRGKRSFKRCKMSRMTAPVGDVTTPILFGKKGIFCFCSGANSPSVASFFFRSSSILRRAPSPASSIDSMTSWYFELIG